MDRVRRAAPELLSACRGVRARLSDLPLASRTPEERLSELEDWIHDEILPELDRALAAAGAPV